LNLFLAILLDGFSGENIEENKTEVPLLKVKENAMICDKFII